MASLKTGKIGIVFLKSRGNQQLRFHSGYVHCTFRKFIFYCLDSVSPLHNKYNVFPLKEKNGIETILSRFIPVHC